MFTLLKKCTLSISTDIMMPSVVRIATVEAAMRLALTTLSTTFLARNVARMRLKAKRKPRMASIAAIPVISHRLRLAQLVQAVGSRDDIGLRFSREDDAGLAEDVADGRRVAGDLAALGGREYRQAPGHRVDSAHDERHLASRLLAAHVPAAQLRTIPLTAGGDIARTRSAGRASAGRTLQIAT